MGKDSENYGKGAFGVKGGPLKEDKSFEVPLETEPVNRKERRAKAVVKKRLAKA